MDNVYSKVRSFGEVLILVSIYFLVPQLVGSLFYYGLKLPEITSVYIGNICVAIIFFFMYKNMLKEKFKEYISSVNNFGDSLKWWGIGFAIMVVSNLLIYKFLISDGPVNEELNRQALLSYPVIGFVSISIIAPFVEEMIFRFGLRKITGNNTMFPIMSFLIFGFLHTVAGLDRSLLELAYIVPYGALGFVFAKAYQKSDNIFSSISAHMMHNTFCYVMTIIALGVL